MLRLFVITVFLVEVAIIAGWWTAEIGRQPWVVYNVLRPRMAIAVLTAIDVVLSLGMFVILYALLLVLFLYLLNREDPARAGAARGGGDGRGVSLPDTFRDIFRRRDRARRRGELAA